MTSKLACFADFGRSKKQNSQFAARPRTLESHTTYKRLLIYGKKTRSPTNSNSARCLFSVRSGSCTLERRIYLTGRQWHRVQSSVWSDEMRMGMGCIAGCCCCCWFCHAGADVTSLAAAAAADLCIYDKQTIGAFLLTACMRTQRNTSRPISANADGPRDAASRKIDYNALFF